MDDNVGAAKIAATPRPKQPVRRRPLKTTTYTKAKRRRIRRAILPVDGTHLQGQLHG
jgi:hypothetical protein